MGTREGETRGTGTFWKLDSSVFSVFCCDEGASSLEYAQDNQCAGVYRLITRGIKKAAAPTSRHSAIQAGPKILGDPKHRSKIKD